MSNICKINIQYILVPYCSIHNSHPFTNSLSSHMHISYRTNYHLCFLQKWPNIMGKNVCSSFRPSVRPYVDTFTMKRNAATNRLVILVEVDLPFTTIWLLRSSEVKVKVTEPRNMRKWPIWKSISSAIVDGGLNVVKKKLCPFARGSSWRMTSFHIFLPIKNTFCGKNITRYKIQSNFHITDTLMDPLRT